MPRSSKPMKRSAMKQRGKRADTWAAFSRASPATDHACELCGGPSVSWHHRGQKSTHPQHRTNPANLIAVCGPCHTYVHDIDPDGSYEAGLLLWSWQEPGSAADPWGAR
jgi:5-methylcytosine-specific restriction endonuclease McrA